MSPVVTRDDDDDAFECRFLLVGIAEEILLATTFAALGETLDPCDRALEAPWHRFSLRGVFGIGHHLTRSMKDNGVGVKDFMAMMTW